MGWRDRDYAKFRKDEFEAIYGRSRATDPYTSATSRGATPRISRARRRRRGSPALRWLKLLSLALVGTAALLWLAIATGKVDDLGTIGNQSASPAPDVNIVPQIQLPLPGVVPLPHRTTRIAGTRLLRYGSTLTLSDSHTAMAGSIVISGRWGAGPWETFAVARATDTTFSFRIPLDRRGPLRLRIAYPDGGRAVGTYDVR